VSADVAIKLLEMHDSSGSMNKQDDYIYKHLPVLWAREDEKRRLARELHDGPAQNLAWVLMTCDILNMSGCHDDKYLRESINKIRHTVKSTLGEIRKIMFDLKLVLPEKEDFGSALAEFLEDYAQRYNFTTRLTIYGCKRRYQQYIEISIFRIVQEAVTNARKHAGTNQAKVIFKDDGQFINITIKDKGYGFDVDKGVLKKNCLGLSAMKERVGMLNGSIKIESAKDQGTTINIKVPIEGEAGNGENKSADS